ncbi:dnaJ homolog subfamily C member 17 [Dermatophagoides farinae]|uniref:dnaJ homolog subfamily C member 17 n=1 Tax=Dermatophagoides farinae TaxID=6954 RepID=UPI003F5F7C49
MEMFDLKNINLYELFDLNKECTESDIKKAFRKKALIHHPDKNPDDPKAKEIFQKLSKALEILTDEKARASYDKILQAKIDREIRDRKFDAKRKKFKDNLEQKEKFAEQVTIIEEEERLKREIERIRKEGSKQLEEENQLLKKKLNESINQAKSLSRGNNVIKVKLKKRSKDSNIIITDELIHKNFKHFGSILSIVKMKKSALIEYEHYDSLKRIAANCPKGFEFEILNVNRCDSTTEVAAAENLENDEKSSNNNNQNDNSKVQQETALPTVDKCDDSDYEEYILKRLQEAEQNKRKQCTKEV